MMPIPRFEIGPGAAGMGNLPFLGGGIILVISVAVLLALFHIATSGRFSGLETSLGISMILTVGFQIFSGSTGIVSFGQPGFVAIGAYAAGIVAVPPSIKAVTLPQLPEWLAQVQLGMLPAMLIGGLAAALVALLVGPIVMRLAGAAASIMTFGFLVIMNEVLRNADALTRGNQTFFGVPKLADLTTVYATAAAVILLAIAFKFSSFGLRARAVREDPLAAETAGIALVSARLMPWVLSAFVMGLGGALMAFFLTAFSPKSFYATLVIPMLLMAVLGGLHSVAGAVVGTLLITGWELFMRLMEGGTFGLAVPLGSAQLTLGAGLVLILYVRASGLLGSGEITIERSESVANTPPRAQSPEPEK